MINKLFLLIIPPVLATSAICNPTIAGDLGGCGGNEESQNIIGRLLARFFASALAIGGIAFLIYLVYGAFRWLTAGDDKAQMQAAKNAMVQAFIGIIILASLFAIARIIGILLGLECIDPGTGDILHFPDAICWPEVSTP